MAAAFSLWLYFFCKNSAYCKYTKKEEKILENGVEIIGTIITDVSPAYFRRQTLDCQILLF